MGLLVGCENEEDQIKNEGAMVTTLFINFSDAQWQLTPKSVMESAKIQTYKSIGIFPNAQGQVTHKPLVGSC